MTDARHRPVEQITRASAGARAQRSIERLAKAQRVEHRDRSRSDREDVAQDAPHTRRRPLKRLHRARMVVRLDLERAHQTAPHVDRTRVLARTHHHIPTLRRQRPQQLLRVLVRTVLAPQQRIHRQLHLIGRAILLFADQLILGARQPELQRVLDRREHRAVRHAHPQPSGASTRRSSAHRSSRPPTRRSRARDGASTRTHFLARCSPPRCRAPSR